MAHTKNVCLKTDLTLAPHVKLSFFPHPAHYPITHYEPTQN